MDTDDTRSPITDGQAVDEIKALLKANTMPDALRTLRDVTATKPLVSVDDEGGLYIASLTVRQVVQLITALEGLTVK